MIVRKTCVKEISIYKHIRVDLFRLIALELNGVGVFQIVINVPKKKKKTRTLLNSKARDSNNPP